MKAWHFSENAYPYLPPAERIRIDPRQPAEPELRSEERRRALRPLSRRMADRRGRRPGDHAQRASPDGDLRRSGGADCAWRAGAADQEGAAADPRQSDRQSPPADPRRRGNGDGRHAVEGPARRRLRARRAIRGAAGQQQSGAHERAPVGGDGPDREGLDQPRWSVQPRGPLLPSPQRQYLAAAVSAAASADLGSHDKPRRRATGRRRGYVQATFLTGFDGTRAIYDTYRKGWREPAAATTSRSTGSPMRRWSIPATPKPGACRRRKAAVVHDR